MNIAIKTSSGLVATGGNKLIATATPNNTGKTTAQAPVLLALQSEETVTALRLADEIQALAPSLSVAEARFVVNSVEQALCEIVEAAQYPVSIQLGFATFMWEVAGSLDAADAEANPLTNTVFMTGLVPERYRKVFASFDTYVPTGDVPCVLKRIRDKATNANAILGYLPFYLEGKGMTFGATGEKCELWDELMLTKKCDLTVTTHDSKIVWECKIPETANVPVGRYTAKVTTFAGEPAAGGTLYTADLKVNVGAAAVPTLPKVVLKNGEVDEWAVKFDVENMEAIRGYSVTESGVKVFNADVYHNGQEDEKDVIVSQFASAGSRPQFSREGWNVPGTVIKIVAHVNPEKTGYDPSDAVYEFTVS